MKKKYILYTAIITLGCSAVLSQNGHKKDNNIRLSFLLLQFLDRSNEDINKLALVDLMDTEKEMYLSKKIDDQIKTIGIYKFGILASHPTSYICFISEDNVKIIEEYSTLNLLEKLSSFFEEHDELFSEEQKLIASRNVLNILETRNFENY